jgi:hypothetical protein
MRNKCIKNLPETLDNRFRITQILEKSDLKASRGLIWLRIGSSSRHLETH